MPNDRRHPFVALIALLGCMAASAQNADEPGAALLRQYAERYHKLPPLRTADGTAPSLTPRVELADWCAAQGLHEQADMLYRQVLHFDPYHDAAFTAIWKLDAAKPLEQSPGRMDALAKEFPNGFFMSETDHFLLLYDTGHVWASTRGNMLERAYANFYTTLHRHGFRLLPLRERLECVLFNNHADYDAYARQRDRIQNPATGGYYSQLSNRVCFFNNQTSPVFRQQLAQVTQLKATVQQLQAQTSIARERGEIARARQLQNQLTLTQRQLAAVERQFNAVSAYNNIAQTYHEAAHQLAFNSGLQQRGVAYPFWVSEGLATCFETISPAAPFGPTHDNPHRRQTLTKAFNARQNVPIDQLISLTNPDRDDPDHLGVLYAQAWGLFHFLYNQRNAQLRGYLAALARRPGVMPDANQLRNEFIASFGPVAEIEAQYRKHAINR